ncbi:MAG: hypothetical protein LBP35_02040 [Candidatus Ancillula trichonymphae]|nr:hypothetical protein [Candidatus Ancillula trichonymphae]
MKSAHFGNSISLFTPLYVANYCEDECTYCGFNRFNKIKRVVRLTKQQVESECEEIAKTGLEEVLILTGESRAFSDYKYIGEACKIAKKHFRVVGVEVQPMNVDEYRHLYSCGADFVTVFQETYDTSVYEIVHPWRQEAHISIPFRYCRARATGRF